MKLAIEKTVMLVGGGPKAILATDSAATMSPKTPQAGLANVLRLPEQLPILLAGPIVRRLESTKATIWLLTSVDVRVRGMLLPAGKTEVLATTTATSTKLGDRMFMHMATFEKASGFPRGTLMAYQFAFDFVKLTPGIAGFTGGNALLNPEEIAYGESSLPTFFLPASGGGYLRALHGSCRKLHGPGADAASGFEDILKKHADDVALRPSALFLTGDQIYADDVHEELIDDISNLGRTLLGWDETIPDPGGGIKRVIEFRSGMRTMVRKCGFSADMDVCGNHLLGFGEFAAMYILAWCPEIWEWQRFRRSASLPGFNRPPLARAMRRVMANIPCYMMFDDHEITDDWNVNSKWDRDTKDDKTAQRIIANGLAAYWIFQGAGNDPGKHAEPAAAIKSYLDNRGSQAETFEKKLLDFHDWHYTAPTTIPAVVLDTRTRRQFIQASGDEDAPGVLNPPPWLMSESAMKSLEETINSCAGGEQDPILIVSPTPVLGYFPAEKGAEWKANLRSSKNAVNLSKDPEAWMHNAGGYIRLMKALARSGRRRFMILSGDVHYGFTASASCWVRTPEVSAEILIVQATSSALRNETEGINRALLIAGEIVNKLPSGPYGSAIGLLAEKFAKSGEHYRVGHFAKKGYELDWTEAPLVDWNLLPKNWEVLIRWKFEPMEGLHTIIDNNAGSIYVDQTLVQHKLRKDSLSVQASVVWGEIDHVIETLPNANRILRKDA